MFNSEEKKVEYIELIYDLIFVYILGRNNSMLEAVSGGFVPATTFLTYLLSTLVVLQIWFYTTLFINRYGSNSIGDYIAIFVNMYLLYYMAQGVRADWSAYYCRFGVAWGLILLNIALCYYFKLRKSDHMMPWLDKHIKSNLIILVCEAAIVFACIPVYLKTGIALGSLGMVFGIVCAILMAGTNLLVPVDFMHLTERVMLYVVFTFGEMIIGIAGYFEGEISFNTVYFSLMAFLIVVGLFSSYGYIYDHIIDREMTTNGTIYMMMHIFLITALNNITNALEFMRESEVDAVSKNIFLVASFIIYFVFLFATGRYAKQQCRNRAKFYVRLGVISAAFAVLVALFYQRGDITIAFTVIYIYTVYAMIVHNHKKKTE